jgi:chitinase
LNISRGISRIGRAGAVGAVIAGMVVGGTIAGAASASAAPACATAWSASTAYTGGATVSKSSTNYTANWWTQGNDPATNSGGSGSGQPWTSTGSCTGGTGGGGGGTGGGGTGTGSVTGTFFSPYKDVTSSLNWNTNVMQTKVTGTVIPIVGASNSLVSTVEPNLGGITLAFATGVCGSENWGGVAGAAFAAANIPALDAAGINYVVSTGGAAGAFTCGSGSALGTFIARYASPHLVGIDFDIETGQSAADISSLVNAAASAQTQYPKLRFSFTLATLGASDGSYGGLNSTGTTVMNAIAASGIVNYTVDLMTMDYGNASTSVCVVSGGVCNMGASAVQAAKNLQHTFGTPLSKIELTPMIGVNDSASNIVSLADVDTISAYAKANGLAGVHFWSLDRDTPCPSAQNTASSTCNSMSGSTALQYTNRFLADLR